MEMVWYLLLYLAADVLKTSQTWQLTREQWGGHCSGRTNAARTATTFTNVKREEVEADVRRGRRLSLHLASTYGAQHSRQKWRHLTANNKQYAWLVHCKHTSQTNLFDCDVPYVGLGCMTTWPEAGLLLEVLDLTGCQLSALCWVNQRRTRRTCSAFVLYSSLATSPTDRLTD